VRFVTKKRVAAAVAAIAITGGGMAAYAYFTDTGSGNGSAGVGTATNWSVTNLVSSGTLYPGAGSATLTYKITNAGTGHQKINAVTVSVAADGSGNVLDSTSGNPVSGCLASWFSVGSSSFTDSGNAATTIPKDLAGADFVNGSTSTTMTNAAVSQDACKLASPRLTVSVS